jgi:Fe-S-cluster containining protein
MTNRRLPKSPAGESPSRNQPARARDRQRRGAPAEGRKVADPSQSRAKGKKSEKTKTPKADRAPTASPKADARLPLYQEPQRSRRSKPSCTACGLCCSYVAIEVDSPKSVKQATLLIWYVYHEGVSLYANDDDWMVQFETTCIHLQPDYRCGVYETRPHICREFSEQDCEVNTGDDGHTFYNATEFMAHLQTTRPRIHAFVMKNFAPPVEPARTRLAPFEHRFQAVMARRKALGA